MAKSAHVTLSGDIEGDYRVTEQGPAGELRLVPDYPSAGTSWKAILERASAREATPEELERFTAEHGPLLPPDGEG